MSTKHPCERCGTRFRRRPRGSVLCPGCRQRRDQARHRAEARARNWIAAQHPSAYANLHATHAANVRAQDPSASAATVRDRARSRALGELQRAHPDQYQQRYAVELDRALAELDQEQASQEQAAARPAAPRVPYWQQRDALARRQAHANAAARLRALLWLAQRHPDTTEEVYREQAARLPLNPADRTPERRRALAWAATLDRLARLHPADFEARYQAELSAARRRLRAS
jgi:uncharacterized Zn finger protein (UPF0148 family)